MKKEFRKKVITTRKNINKNLLSLECIRNTNTIMLHLDFNNEV